MLRLVGLLLAAGLISACVGGTPSHGPGGTTSVDEARRLDDQALAAWTPGQDRFAVIANGHVTVASSFEDAADKAAHAMPTPAHVYLVDSVRPRVDAWEFSAPYGDRSVIGLDALSELVDTIEDDPHDRKITLSKDGRSVTLTTPDRVAVVRFLIRSASDPAASKNVELLVASGFKEGVFLRGADADGLGLERSEEPGRTGLSAAGFGDAVACRRAVVWIEIPELRTRALVHVAVPETRGHEWRSPADRSPRPALERQSMPKANPSRRTS